jgi:superfamily I DNA/RNA helicase
MEFRIADTFTESLARLTGEEQKAAKTTAFDLQVSPSNPGLQFHKLDHARDRNFWSVRVNADVRLIVHRTQGNLLLCYVDHHDKAYAWAERRRIETHPKTGAAQLVEIRETVQEVLVQRFVEPPLFTPEKPRLFERIPDDELLGYGVPEDWLADVRGATEDSLLSLADYLPGEAAEALLELATGGKPRVVQPKQLDVSPFDHPDARRRFRTMADVTGLERALEFPWDKWTIFLHPDQQELVERTFDGPARVSGSAGTGKTIVALHRAVALAKQDADARVLLTTFSEVLANALRVRLRRLLGTEPRLAERIDVETINSIGLRLFKADGGRAAIATRTDVDQALHDASGGVEAGIASRQFLHEEWSQVVDAWQVDGWETYRDVVRLGRKTRLPEAQRRRLWSIFERVRASLAGRGLVTWAGMFRILGDRLASSPQRPFDHVVVDECQDIGVAQLRFLSALAGGLPNGLFFAGDLGQRIFQQPFSWKSQGVDIRGRSRILRVNYRTSHQIRAQADRLLAPNVSDVDGNTEQRDDTISLFNGPAPIVRGFESPSEEALVVGRWIAARLQDQVAPHEIGVFVRSESELPRAIQAVDAATTAFGVLDDRVEPASGRVAIGTMHLAKGLEFKAVAVMACDDEIVPLQRRIESVGDDADLQEVYETERHLLYVACTRAREHLHISGVEPVSEFLDDLREARHGETDRNATAGDR